MTKYYSFDNIPRFYEFLYDMLGWFVLFWFGVIFSFRIYKSIKKRYMDLLKITQLLWAILIWIRFNVAFVISISTELEDNELAVAVFRFLTSGKYLYCWLIQYSWYILIHDLKEYKKDDWWW